MMNPNAQDTPEYQQTLIDPFKEPFKEPYLLSPNDPP